MDKDETLAIVSVLIGFIFGAVFVCIWASVYHRGTCAVCLKQDATVNVIHARRSIQFNVCDECVYELLKDKVR